MDFTAPIKRLSDEAQISVISEIFQVEPEEAARIADKIYSKGMEIVKTQQEESDFNYSITKKFLAGSSKIEDLAKEHGMPYNQLYKLIRETISRASGEKSIWINSRESRQNYLQYFN